MRTDACRWMVAAAVWTGIVAFGSPAVAADITWKASVWGPKRTSSAGFEWYAKEVAAKTGGQMKIELAYDQGKPTEAPEKLKSAAVEASYFCAQYTADKLALVTVLDLPMLAPDNTATLGRVQLALADHPALAAELGKWNIKMLVPAPTPQFQLMGTRRIAKIDDLKGARIRAPTGMSRILEEYGASASVGTNAAENIAALKSGSVDLIALPMFSFAAYKLDDVSKHMTDKISLGVTFCYFGVGQKAWDALPPKVQQVMLGLRAPAVAKYEEIFAAEAAGYVAGFKQKGLELSTFSTTDRARLVARAIKIWQAWVEEREKQGLAGREVFEFTQAKIREHGRKQI